LRFIPLKGAIFLKTAAEFGLRWLGVKG